MILGSGIIVFGREMGIKIDVHMLRFRNEKLHISFLVVSLI